MNSLSVSDPMRVSSPKEDRRSYGQVVGDRSRTFGRPPRLMGVDVARGLAILGMIGAHIGLTETFDWARVETWLDVVHGRSSILFAVVAGVSIALMTGGRRRPGDDELPALRLRLLGRAAVVFVLGLILESLNTGIAVILVVYAIAFVAVMPFLRWRRRWLFALAGALALLGPVVLATLQIASLYATGTGLSFVFGIYPISVWMAFVLAGLAIGRTDLLSSRNAALLAVAGVLLAAAGYGIAAFVPPSEAAVDGMSGSSAASSGSAEPIAGEKVDLAGLQCVEVEAETFLCGRDVNALFGAPGSGGDGAEPDSYLGRVWASDPLTAVAAAVMNSEPHSGGVLEIVGSGGFAIAVLGLCLLISRALRVVVFPIAALGSMPLTAYTAHVVSVVFISGTAGVATDNVAWLSSALVGLGLCTLWVVLVGRGPLERIAAAVADRAARGVHAPRNRPADSAAGDLEATSLRSRRSGG